jgi:hypothetical protein
MQRVLIMSVSAVVLTWGANAVAAPQNLKGDYAFTSSSACIAVAPPNTFNSVNGGFTPHSNTAGLEDNQVTFGESSATEGVKTFLGNGNGTNKSSSMSITFPAKNEGAGSSDSTYPFTYKVNLDGTWTQQEGTTNGTVTTGPRKGQTFTVTGVPVFTGRISQDGKTLTLASLTPGVETVTYSNGNVQLRVCHRSTVLTSISQSSHSQSQSQSQQGQSQSQSQSSH